MRRWLLGALLGVLVLVNAGCIIPAFSGDPTRRTQQLLFVSDNFRKMLEEWERIWFLDQPDHMTPYRSHGVIL